MFECIELRLPETQYYHFYIIVTSLYFGNQIINIHKFTRYAIIFPNEKNTFNNIYCTLVFYFVTLCTRILTRIMTCMMSM